MALDVKAGVDLNYNDAAHKHAVTHIGSTQKYWYDANGSQITRILGADTYDLKYDAENRLVEVKKNNSVIATFVYDGDGKRVKSSINGTTTTFIGGHYEMTGSTITKYYFAGMSRVAMRVNSTVSYLLSDHLGSTSITTDSSGKLVSELRYKAWGEVRYPANGQNPGPSDYTYTGQYSNTDDFGLMFYNARWYDPTIGRFTSADIVTPSGVQGLDRYAYVNNGPIKYTDPTGHMVDEGDDGGVGGCSVMTGSFTGSFTCTPEDLNGATIEQRQSWFREMLASVNAALVEEFNNINGVLNAFIATDNGAPGTWMSWGDAGILNSIQNGLAMFQDKPYISNSSSYSATADKAWNEYFKSFDATGPSNETLRLWGAAEGAGTTYGRWLA